ncbi:MAG: hypothetical protein Kow00124_08140 [Anaerolineae bacterium]
MTDDKPFTAAAFYQYIAEHRLMGARCPACDALFLPPRAICPHCHSAALEWVELSGRGRLAAFTAIYVAPTFMIEQGFGRDNPYLTGIVELEEGVKISARIVGMDPHQPEAIRVGTPLTVAYLERGEGESRRVDLAFKP